VGYQIQNPQLQSLYGALFNYKNSGTRVYALHRGWAFEYYLLDILNRGKSRPVNSPDGSYRKWFQTRSELTSQIKTVTQMGLNIKVEFYDTTTEIFRMKRVLYNNRSRSNGRVIETGPGYVVIESHFNDPNTITAASDWKINDFVTDIGDVSGNRYSAGSKQIFQTRDYRDEYSSVKRYSCEFARRDKLVSFAGQGPVVYKYSQFEKDMVNDMMKSYGLTSWFSKPGTGNSQLEGVVNGTCGIDEAIVQQGLALNGTAPFTYDEWEMMASQSADANPEIEQELAFVGGRDMLRRLQTFAAMGNDFVKYSDVAVTSIGGEKLKVTGDVRQATIAGLTFKVMMRTLFNNKKVLPQPSATLGINGTINSNSLYLLNLAPIPSENDGDGVVMLPAIEKFHWASDKMEMKSNIYKVVTGMTGPDGNHTGPNLAGYETTSNEIDGWSGHILQDVGISCMADTWARWRPLE
jgi:hypothetical protein